MTTNQNSSNNNLVGEKNKIGYEGKSIVTVDTGAYLPKTMEQKSRFWDKNCA
jgi:hypothetical protein